MEVLFVKIVVYYDKYGSCKKQLLNSAEIEEKKYESMSLVPR